ncbi:SprT-like domain-containing protein [Crocinitomix algicola]|uniref:SprT-like domain-containing protein n=1 Tax=Crocinitomix algicola TaxID=1740263 RepID=UPI001585EE9D|nr:SprT-like domain-containing protein [Crocinitomix algicola]
MDKSARIEAFAQELERFLPTGSSRYIASFIIEHVVHFTVSKKRKTKLGDYRHPFRGQPHRISVNGDLNQYAFLITTLHEMAHLTTYNKYKNRVKPHGLEWKKEFQNIAAPILSEIELPDDIRQALTNYLKNAKASSCTDDRLYRVLKRYDKSTLPTLETLKFGAHFKLNGKIYVKGKKLRTRFECQDVSSQKFYRVLGLAEVEHIEN